MYSNQKKWILMLFAIKSSFKFAALATPNEVDLAMKDWWRMRSLQKHIKASCLYFPCLTTALLHQHKFVFCWGKLLTTTEKTVTWTTRMLWFPTWHWDPFKNPDPFLHWVIFIGCGWSGNFLRLDLRVLQCQIIQVFFLEYLFTHRATITFETLLAQPLTNRVQGPY